MKNAFILFNNQTSLPRTPHGQINDGMASIQPLAPNVAEELRASLVINSLEQCTTELIQNGRHLFTAHSLFVFTVALSAFHLAKLIIMYLHSNRCRCNTHRDQTGYCQS